MALINNTQKQKDDKIRIYIIISCLLLCTLTVLYKWIILPGIKNFYDSRKSILNVKLTPIVEETITSHTPAEAVSQKHNKIQNNNINVKNEIKSNYDSTNNVVQETHIELPIFEESKENTEISTKLKSDNSKNKINIEDNLIKEAENELL